MSEDVDPGVRENVDRWQLLALVYGYNELAKKAETFGEKVYFRVARDVHEAELKKFGCEIQRTGDTGPVVLVLDHRMPHVQLEERDLGLMRSAVEQAFGVTCVDSRVARASAALELSARASSCASGEMASALEELDRARASLDAPAAAASEK